MTTRLRMPRVLHDAAGGLQAVQPRHLHVHQHDVGRSRRVTTIASSPSLASPTTSMSSSASRIMPEAGPHHGLVVDQHDADRHCRLARSAGTWRARRTRPADGARRGGGRRGGRPARACPISPWPPTLPSGRSPRRGRRRAPRPRAPSARSRPARWRSPLRSACGRW